ncbi:hypothetical protein [Desulfosporosinus sp.]|uniref:hypothetical protein n=1 Tax=Desulfosporosinus sp. TaxID=157907 RepID=UPI00260236BE|nr:hypothetical protein [Desulfosporosinus sp.]
MQYLLLSGYYRKSKVTKGAIQDGFDGMGKTTNSLVPSAMECSTTAIRTKESALQTVVVTKTIQTLSALFYRTMSLAPRPRKPVGNSALNAMKCSMTAIPKKENVLQTAVAIRNIQRPIALFFLTGISKFSG